MVTFQGPVPQSNFELSFGLLANVLRNEVLPNVAKLSRENKAWKRTSKPTQKRKNKKVRAPLFGDPVPTTKVPWVIPLKAYEIPEAIKAAIKYKKPRQPVGPSRGATKDGSEGGGNDLEGDDGEDDVYDQLERLLPPSLSPETHTKFWHALLYAEEVQAM